MPDTTTDRELLELAAKAAGYTVRCVGDGRHGGDVVFYMEPSQLYWNPLTDDGDALRLAVAVGLNIDPGSRISKFTEASIIRDHKRISAEEKHGDFPCAATRLAITRAAAQVQREREAG